MILVTNRFIPLQFKAVTRGPIIFIRPEAKDDAALLTHERVHVKQWLRTFGLHSFLYLFSQGYRLRAEAEAYRAQLAVAGQDHIGQYAGFLVDKYGLNLTLPEALGMLRDA